jgi:Phage integrase, N-terminal SAM-like domain
MSKLRPEGSKNHGDNVLASLIDQEIDYFQQFLNAHDFSHNTRRAFTLDLRKFVAWFTQTNKELFRITRITTRDISDFKDYLRKKRGQAVATVNRCLVTLRRYLGWLAVLYLALIAFWGERCRFVIRSADVCYTENLAKDCRDRRGFLPRTPLKGSLSYLATTPPLPPPVQSRFSRRLSGRRAMVLPQCRGMDRACRTAQADALPALQGCRHADSARLLVRI